jgi:ketosteroid isomerase-like protein
MTADTAGVVEAYNQRMAGIEGDNMEQWLDAHASNVRFSGPDGPDMVGKEAIQAWGKPFFDDFIMRFNETREELRVAGDLAFIRYRFDGQVIPKAGGDPIESRGRGLLILQRDEGGTWKITHNIWNNPLPPAVES